MHAPPQHHSAPARRHVFAGHRRRVLPEQPARSSGGRVAEEARDALLARGIEVLSTAWDEQALHLRVEVLEAAFARVAAQHTADEAAERIRPDARVEVTVVPAALAFA